MKKVLALALALTLMLSLCACGRGPDLPNDTTPDVATPDVTTPTNTDQGTTNDNPTTKPETEVTTSYEITDSRAITWTDSIGNTWVQTIVEITNTGTTNLYLSSGAYDLEDTEGRLVASETLVSEYPNVLAPGEKGYMYDETTLDEAVDSELTVLPRVDVQEATVERIRFPVTDVEIVDREYGGIKVKGRVENTSDEDENMVYVVAFLYDVNGACIGGIYTMIMEDLAAGAKIGFEMSEFSMPDGITADSVADFVVYAYPYQLQF